jgi:hypothetical protein
MNIATKLAKKKALKEKLEQDLEKVSNEIKELEAE